MLPIRLKIRFFFFLKILPLLGEEYLSEVLDCRVALEIFEEKFGQEQLRITLFQSKVLKKIHVCTSLVSLWKWKTILHRSFRKVSFRARPCREDFSSSTCLVAIETLFSENKVCSTADMGNALIQCFPPCAKLAPTLPKNED